MTTGTALDRTETIDARTLDISTIPVIDFAPFRNGSGEAQRQVAQAIGDACRHTGFFYIINHGIPETGIDSLIHQTLRFFHQPLEEKLRLDIDHVQRHRGYVPQGALYADVNAQPDVQEGYEVSLELPSDDPDYLAGNIMLGPNVWPDNLPGFQTAVYAYYESVLGLARMLLRAFEITLGLEEGWFDDKTDKPMGQ
ncbi:MAG: hypothetical protein OXI95_14375 [bacterium]|nr:hypothetical protein [bacterium]